MQLLLLNMVNNFNYIEKITSSAGGYYSDDVGYVGESCKKCPNGSFVQFDKAPGTSNEDCKSCPEGNNRTIFAKQIMQDFEGMFPLVLAYL